MSQINQIPTIWTTGWTEIFNTGTWRSAFPEYQLRPSPCHNACPIEGEIPVWIQQLKNKDFYDSWLTLVKNNPFPAVTGRVCHHPCQSACNRNHYDDTVAVNAMEQFIGDMALVENWSLPAPLPEINLKIAVVGAGPAGLSAAFHLRQAGCQVTVLEAQAEPGGTLRYGIPSYRLPKDVLAQEINRLIETGVKIVTNSPVAFPGDLALLKQTYDVIYLAVGAQKPKKLPLLDYTASWVLDGLSYLKQINCQQAPVIGNRVLVVGGGSAAMDVARTARRFGKEVALIALENRGILPAHPAEIKEALEEGIKLYDGAMITAFREIERGLAFTCVEVTLDPNAPVGVLRPLPIEGSDFTIEADTIITAIGQNPDLSNLDNFIKTGNSLIIVDENNATSQPFIFAGGDATSQERFVSFAIGMGKKAASIILNSLGRKQECQSEIQHGKIPEVSYSSINTFYFPSMPKLQEVVLGVEDRIENFKETKIKINVEQALLEANRCFSCGHCLKCDNCFYFCPDMAVTKNLAKEDYEILEQYCKGCGLCVEECPRGVLALKEEIR
ncbi:MAG: FAD-dependent oxidoreductase [Clostridia bacterium]|nr:FAD-dependent oxidoreductase [Clostridia bacterium]